MQIVIEIEDKLYQSVQDGTYCGSLYKELKEGKPLPKGHGDLVDYTEMKSLAKGYGAYTEATLSQVKPNVIIEADEEEND